MSILDKLKKTATSKVAELSTSQFYTDSNVNGFASKKETSEYLSNLDTRELEELEQLFAYLKDGKRIDFVPIARNDRNGNPYVWINIQLRKGNLGLKVLLFADLLRFLKEYQDGAFAIGFTLEDLYEEAERDTNAA